MQYIDYKNTTTCKHRQQLASLTVNVKQRHQWPQNVLRSLIAYFYVTNKYFYIYVYVSTNMTLSSYLKISQKSTERQKE